MKKEECDYLGIIKKKDGKSTNQIKLEIQRDIEFQKKMKRDKKKKKEKAKIEAEKLKDINKRFKQKFGKLK